jgi:hypothetical protein
MCTGLSFHLCSFWHLVSSVGWPRVPKSWDLSQIECSTHRGPKYIHIGAERLWRAILGFHQLPSLDISRCLFLQVVILTMFLLCTNMSYLILLLTMLFCMFRQLVDDSLSCMAEACPLIEHLVLSSCLSISIGGLSSLHCLHKLTLLDLSYTFLSDLEIVFGSCQQLKVGLIVLV